MATAPAVTMAIDTYRNVVMRSFNMKIANNVLKTIDVSRRAATDAMGAFVMAQSARLYEAKVQAPPSAPLGQ